jgi:hypothetical protein
VKRSRWLAWPVLAVAAFALAIGGGAESAAWPEIPTSANPAKDGGFGPKMDGVQLGVVMKDTEFIQLALKYLSVCSVGITNNDGRGKTIIDKVSKSLKAADIAAITDSRHSSKAIQAESELWGYGWQAERLPEKPELCKITRYELRARDLGADELSGEGFVQKIIDGYGVTRLKRNSDYYDTYSEDNANNGWKLYIGYNYGAGGNFVRVETARTK